jgi:hypothetical protein
MSHYASPSDDNVLYARNNAGLSEADVCLKIMEEIPVLNP